jgi:hypothetical protein
MMGEASETHGDTRDENRIWVENLRERDHLENLGTYGRIILKWIFNNLNGSVLCLRIRTGVGRLLVWQ